MIAQQPNDARAAVLDRIERAEARHSAAAMTALMRGRLTDSVAEREAARILHRAWQAERVNPVPEGLP